MTGLSVTPMRIGPDRVDHGTADGAVIVVRSPYDGHEVGRVPRGTADDIDAAVASAMARRRGEPMPAHQRAGILDRAAALLASGD